MGLLLVANACALLLLQALATPFDYLARMMVCLFVFAPMIWIVLGQSSLTRVLMSVVTPWGTV